MPSSSMEQGLIPAIERMELELQRAQRALKGAPPHESKAYMVTADCWACALTADPGLAADATRFYLLQVLRVDAGALTLTLTPTLTLTLTLALTLTLSPNPSPRFYLLQAAWLLRLARQPQADAQASFACIPEACVMDMAR